MEKKVRVLLAEDDSNLGKVLLNFLKAKGFDAHLFANGEIALNAFRQESFDFCIIDVMMPLKDGFTLAKDIRKINPHIPFMFLTAKALQQDVLDGFQLGADDYITKPFSMEELTVRIHAILRRASAKPELEEVTDFTIGKYKFDFNRQVLSFKKKEQKLTSKEAALLKLLCENENQVLDRSLALNLLWNDDNYFNARSMDVYITRLRKYLKEDSMIELMNVHGVGFKLVTK
jgi:two-component system, OmpR family, response regulator